MVDSIMNISGLDMAGVDHISLQVKLFMYNRTWWDRNSIEIKKQYQAAIWQYDPLWDEMGCQNLPKIQPAPSGLPSYIQMLNFVSGWSFLDRFLTSSISWNIIIITHSLTCFFPSLSQSGVVNPPLNDLAVTVFNCKIKLLIPSRTDGFSWPGEYVITFALGWYTTSVDMDGAARCPLRF